MLPNDKRSQLDSIVQKMVANNEPDDAIRFVVGDFKKKYSVAQPTKVDNRDWLDKATDFIKAANIPGAKLGEAVGNSIGSIAGSIPFALKGNFSAARAAIKPTANEPTAKQVVGDTVRAAALPASLAVGGGPTVLSNAARFGGLAAASGAGDSLVKGNDPKTVAIDSFKAGLTGAVVGAGTKIIGNAVQKVSQKAPEHLYNNSLKVLQKVKNAGKSPSEFLKDEGVWGNLGTFKKAAQEGIKTEGAAIRAALPNIKTPPPAFDTIQQEAANLLDKSLGGLYSKAQIQQLLDDVPVAALKDAKNPASWELMDEVRSKLGTLIGDGKWLSTNPAEKTKAAQAVYRALAKNIQQASGTTEQFARLSKWIQTNKIVDRAVGLADSKYGLGLYDAISGAGGAVVGFGSGDTVGERLKNAAIGGATGVALERGVNSPAVKTGVAQIVSHLGELPTDTLGRVSKAAVVDLIARLMATSQETPPPDQQELPQ